MLALAEGLPMRSLLTTPKFSTQDASILMASNSIDPNGTYDPKKITLRIQYCGGWGYFRFYEQLKIVLEKEFGNLIDFEPIQDIGTTGNFDITLMQTRQLIHSKTKSKDGKLGKCDSESERKRLINILNVYKEYIEKK